MTPDEQAKALWDAAENLHEKEGIAVIAAALREREQGVWEQAAKFWETVDASEMAKQYPSEQYPKWRDIFVAWCRAQQEPQP